ncbi:MAG: hypothetical protein ACI8PZ_003722 [Myxococcota bacterium]|jgi:hypothetical protein
MFCSPYDEVLAHDGPGTVFLRDREGLWRFAPNWCRDAWTRNPGEHAHGWVYLLARDKASGFVQLALVTSPTLLVEHPRQELRVFADLEAAEAARAAFGTPPIAVDPW